MSDNQTLKDYEQLILIELQKLDLDHKREQERLHERQRAERQEVINKVFYSKTVRSSSNERKLTKTNRSVCSGDKEIKEKVPLYKFKDSSGAALSIGDRVILETSGATGNKGDIAEILRYTKEYLIIRILHNGQTTTRRSYNLTLTESEK